MTKAKVTAEVDYKTDEASFRAANQRSRQMSDDYNRAVRNLQQEKMPGINRAQMTGMGQWNHLLGQGQIKADLLSKAHRDLGGASSRAGMGILEISRAFEDAQYGMKGVLNNIPGMVMAFGGTSGLAGALSMAAVSTFLLYKSWVYLQEALGNEESEAAAATRLRKLAEAQKESTRRLKEHTEAYRAARDDRTERETGGMAHLDRDLQRTNELAAAQADLASAQREAMEHAARARADAIAAHKAEEDSLNRQIALLVKKEAIEKDRIAESTARIAAMDAELKGLEKMTTAVRDSHGNIEAVSTFKHKDAARGTLLEADLATERKRLDDLMARRDAATAGRGDATFQRDQILPVKLAADLERARQMEVKEKEEAATRSLNAAIDSLDDAMDTFMRTVKDSAAAVKELADKAREMTGTREDAGIAHLRARGRGRQADREQSRLTEKRRIDALKQEGFSEDEAGQIATQERRDATRKIGGAGPGRQFTGLDAFDRRQRAFRPETPALDRAAREDSSRPATAKETKEPGGKDNTLQNLKTALDPVIDVLKQIKSAFSPADKLQPAPR